jgi:hypothetical protein
MNVKDLEYWAGRYGSPIPVERYKNTMLFGSNPEVEDVLLASGCKNLRVFDDRVSHSLVPCEPWDQGLLEISSRTDKHYFLVCGVASTPMQRAKAIKRIEDQLSSAWNWVWTNVRSSTAYVSEHAKLGMGVLVLDMCYVGPLVHLDNHVAMLPASKIYHHGRIEEYSILVGGCTCLGHSIVAEGSRVCGNAVVFPHAVLGPGKTAPALTAVPAEREDAAKFFEEFGRKPE